MPIIRPPRNNDAGGVNHLIPRNARSVNVRLAAAAVILPHDEEALTVKGQRRRALLVRGGRNGSSIKYRACGRHPSSVDVADVEATIHPHHEVVRAIKAKRRRIPTRRGREANTHRIKYFALWCHPGTVNALTSAGSLPPYHQEVGAVEVDCGELVAARQ